jgi:pseudaminic acid biosynthesis-associated methylase
VLNTRQISEWKGEFGREYTDRNTLDPNALDALYEANYGITRSSLNQSFLEGVPLGARILEVGCNIGNQLLLLAQAGYTDLNGIEIQSYAVNIARSRVPSASIVEASAFEIPHPDRHFDLVFTSGVLIHIAPQDLPTVIAEICRTANTWIWGMEYYAPSLTEIPYRGHQSLLWKNDFARAYLSHSSDLELVRERRLDYLNSPNADSMFLLKKKSN